MELVAKKRPKLDESWFDKPSETTIVIGDGDPGFKLELKQVEEFRRRLTDKGLADDT